MSEDTPTRILQAALVDFSERGYSGASMRRIAAIVRVQAPSIYAHFKSKEALLQALLEREGPVSGTTLLEQARSAGALGRSKARTPQPPGPSERRLGGA